MKRLTPVILSLALAFSGGCGRRDYTSPPLTDEERRKIQEEDRRVEDEESRQGGGKKARPPRTGRGGDMWEP